MMKTLFAAATVALLGAPAFAQAPTQPKTAPVTVTAEKFTKLDANADGSLSLTEVQSMDAKTTQTDFDKYDGDKNKSLSSAEFGKWVEAKMTPPASAPG